MFYAIYVPSYCDLPDDEIERPQKESLVFSEIKEANAALKRYKGSRMKTFPTREKALSFLSDPEQEESFIDLDSSCQDMVNSFEKLSVNQNSSPITNQLSSNLSQANVFLSPTKPLSTVQTTATPAADEAEPAYPSAKPATLNQLRRRIEAGDYEAVEEVIWSNPRCLVSVCDTAIYLMAGPKYNACHIAARANKPDIMALILDTISNFSFLRKLYPKESDLNLQDRVNHLLDSYLNTPDPRQGNTPLHFACKLDFHRVVRVLLTFEGCDLKLKDSNGKTAEEATDNPKIKNMFKQKYHLPLHRDQLKKRLILERRRSRADSDTSFSDIDDSFMLNSPNKQSKSFS